MEFIAINGVYGALEQNIGKIKAVKFIRDDIISHAQNEAKLLKILGRLFDKIKSQNIKIGDKVILKRQVKETKLQSEYYKQIYNITEKNGSMVTLHDINRNVLFRNITYVIRVNITEHKEDKNTSIQEEKKFTHNKNVIQFIKSFKQGGTVMIGYYVIYSGFHFVVNLDYMFCHFERSIQSTLTH